MTVVVHSEIATDASTSESKLEAVAAAAGRTATAESETSSIMLQATRRKDIWVFTFTYVATMCLRLRPLLIQYSASVDLAAHQQRQWRAKNTHMILECRRAVTFSSPPGNTISHDGGISNSNFCLLFSAHPVSNVREGGPVAASELGLSNGGLGDSNREVVSGRLSLDRAGST